MIAPKQTVVFCICALSFVAGCSSRSVDINGYRIASPYNGHYYIVNNQDVVVVEPNIRQIGLNKHYLYGSSISYEYPDGHTTAGGFFVLNTLSGVTTQGLSRDSFLAVLKNECGISSSQMNLKTIHVD